MKFNTQGAKEQSKANLHPEGKWDATVIGAEVKETKTGRQMIVLQWKTSTGKLRSYHTYVEEYPGLFLDPMYALGFTEEYFESDPELDDVALECLKRRALLDVSHKEFQGNQTASVESVNTIPDSGIKPSA